MIGTRLCSNLLKLIDVPFQMQFLKSTQFEKLFGRSWQEALPVLWIVVHLIKFTVPRVAL